MLRVKSIVLGRPLIGPQSVNIHIIQACDRRCAFCWYFSPLIKNPPEYMALDYDVLERTLDDCADMGVDEINFEGGEVVLYPQAEQAFRKVKDSGMRLIAYSHLDFEPGHLKYLAWADQLTVNLSAATQDLYRKVHGKPAGSLKNLLRNLDVLVNLRNKYGKPKIILTFIVYQENYRQLDAFLELAQHYQVDRVEFRFFKATREMRDLMLTREAVIELSKIVGSATTRTYGFKHNLQSLRGLISDSGMFEKVVSIDHSAMHNDRLFFYDSTGGKKYPCYFGWFYGHIDERGRVIAPCDSIGRCIAGNIYQRSFREIWFENDVLRRVLNEAADGVETSFQQWQECRHCSNVMENRQLCERVERLSSRQSPGAG